MVPQRFGQPDDRRLCAGLRLSHGQLLHTVVTGELKHHADGGDGIEGEKAGSSFSGGLEPVQDKAERHAEDGGSGDGQRVSLSQKTAPHPRRHNIGQVFHIGGIGQIGADKGDRVDDGKYHGPQAGLRHENG